MKNILLALTIVLLFAGAHLLARQTPATTPSVPCNDDKKKEVVEHDPLADPAEELRIRNQKKMDEKNFKELQDASTELAAISARMSKEIDASGQYVVSIRVLNDLDRIEKLTKKVRSRAK